MQHGEGELSERWASSEALGVISRDYKAAGLHPAVGFLPRRQGQCFAQNDHVTTTGASNNVTNKKIIIKKKLRTKRATVLLGLFGDSNNL